MVRLTRWILVLAVLSAVVLFFAYRRKGQDTEGSATAKSGPISPEEAQRLVRQALAQPRETVRLKLDPTDPTAAPLPPPKILAAEPAPAPAAAPAPVPAPAAPAKDGIAAMEARKHALTNLSSVFERLKRTKAAASNQAVPAAPAAPAAPTPAGQ